MNLFKIMQGIRSLAQAGKIDYHGAIKYLNELGVEMDGIVKQALDNVFKKGKARDPEFGDTVVKMQIDEQGVPFNPNTLKSTTEKRNIESLGKDATPLSKSIQEFFDAPKAKRGVENLFQKKSKTLADELAEGEGVETFETILPTKPLKEPKYGKLDYDRIAKIEGVDVEEIRGKSFREIIEYLAAVRDKADGGRIGYVAGGLTGQAKNIYDSWISAGHSSQDALDYLSSKGMYNAGGDGGVESIINTQQSIIPGADGRSGGIGIQTPIGQNISNFQSAINTRQNRLNNPGKIAEFAYSMGMPKQASVNELLARGMRGPRDTTLMSNIPFGISGLISKALPDMYGDMTLADQITTQAYMGYTDPNTNMANKDPFGINVRSAFGNYAEKAAEIVDTLNAKALRNDGYLSDYDKQRLNHYRNVTQTKQSAAADLGLIEIAKQEKAKQEAAKAAAQLAAVSELTGNVQTGGGKGIASSGVASGSVDPSGMGGGSMQAKSSGAQDTDRDDGGWGWAHGGPVGLATMFTRRR